MFDCIKNKFKKKKTKPIVLGADLEAEYCTLYDTMFYEEAIVARVCEVIAQNKAKYVSVSDKSGVPWIIVAAIHSLEGGLSFSNNLYNGQKYWEKTTWVPKGLGPWSSWEESAIECMSEFADKFNFNEWSIPEMCYALESHNGWGYRKYHSHVKSPYLWSGSNHYSSGKYVSDGKWSESAVSKQVGAMCIIKQFVGKR